MKLKDIAKRGLKGRKKDTFLINLVITLSFIFIITAIIFQSSIEKTKKEQSYDELDTGRMKIFELSYNERYKDYYKRDTTIKAGDTINLAANAEGEPDNPS